MTIQLKSSGVILLTGGSIAVDPDCCCGSIDLGACTCNGANSINVDVTDNFGYSIDTSGSYPSVFFPALGGCQFDVRSSLYDSSGTTHPNLAWRIRAPVVLSGGLVRVRMDWVSYETGFDFGVIDVPYTGVSWTFNHPLGGGRNVGAAWNC